jgi:translation initiation factor 2 subunit 1
MKIKKRHVYTMNKLGNESEEIQQTFTSQHKSNLFCRMYPQKYPDVDQLVMVTVKQITEVGVYVNLLEYYVEGMILLSELSRHRRINTQAFSGLSFVAIVLRVDKEKGYIDLSKKKVSLEDIKKYKDKYNKSKIVHSIMRHVAECQNLDLEVLYNSIGWPLYEQYGHAIEAFKIAVTHDENIFKGLKIDDLVRKELLENIKKRLTPQVIKISYEVECSCFGYDGIDAVKIALKAGEECSNSDITININLIAAPLYIITINCLDKSLGITRMKVAITTIDDSIKKFGGVLNIKTRYESDNLNQN